MENLRVGNRQLRGDERFQQGLLALREGRRLRAVVGLAGSLSRRAHDRVEVGPAWLLLAPRGYKLAALRVNGLQPRMATVERRLAPRLRAWWSIVRRGA